MRDVPGPQEHTPSYRARYAAASAYAAPTDAPTAAAPAPAETQCMIPATSPQTLLALPQQW
jgi:hypothetical protein